MPRWFSQPTCRAYTGLFNFTLSTNVRACLWRRLRGGRWCKRGRMGGRRGGEGERDGREGGGGTTCHCPVLPEFHCAILLHTFPFFSHFLHLCSVQLHPPPCPSPPPPPPPLHQPTTNKRFFCLATRISQQTQVVTQAAACRCSRTVRLYLVCGLPHDWTSLDDTVLRWQLCHFHVECDI